MKSLLCIILLIEITIQICSKGCLKCTTSNNCLLCDSTLFYKLENSTCIKKDHPNCEKMDIKGNCINCLKNYWLNSSTKKCTEIESEKIIENCLSYGNNQNCYICENHFIFQNSKCVAVKNKITNCEIYKSLTPDLQLLQRVKLLLIVKFIKA